MNDIQIAPASPPGHRVRELVVAYRSLRNSDGRVVDVPAIALNNPRNAAAVRNMLFDRLLDRGNLGANDPHLARCFPTADSLLSCSPNCQI